MESKQKRLYKIVLTGGPCGGKTTGQSRLCTFFENLGWKVFRVPETATVLLREIQDSMVNGESHLTAESSLLNHFSQYGKLRLDKIPL